MADVGLWTGLNQATGTALATGMKLMDYAGDQRHRAAVEANQAAQLQIAKDKADMEKTAFKYAEQERQTKEKQLNAFVPVSAVAPNVHQLPETKKFYIQTLKDAGHEVKETPDGEIYVTNRGINYLKELTTTKTEFGKVQLDNVLTDLQGQSVAIGQQIAQMQESGKADEKTLVPLQQKQMAIKLQIANVLGSQKDVAEKVLLKQMDIEEARIKAGEASKTEEQLIRDSLRETLKREPTATEILAGLQKRKIEIAKNTAAARVNVTTGAMSNLLSPDALKIEGIKFATTGQMPSMGMGNAAVRMKIMTSAAEYLKEQGIDPKTVPAIQAEFKATVAAFKSVKTPLANFQAFENALIKNANYAFALSKSNYRTQFPPVNVVMNAIRTRTGDPKIVKFSAAIYAAAMEYEKIRTAGTNITSAELSIGAQKKAEEIMNKAQTHAQLGAVIEAMKVDAKNVVDSRREQLGTLSNEMRTLGKNLGIPLTSGGGQTVIRYDAKGNRL